MNSRQRSCHQGVTNENVESDFLFGIGFFVRIDVDVSVCDRIVGVGCAALKTARMHSVTCKIGYIFDLRVDEDYKIGDIFSLTRLA